MISEKRLLRAKFRSVRNSIDKALLMEESEKIFQHFIKSDFYKNAEVIFIYVSVGSEVETEKIIKAAFADGKRVAVPLCDAESRTMKAVLIDDMSELNVGSYGIPEPKDTSRSIAKSNIDLVVVPALAFDKNRMRLGYGGGYYDKFLEGFNGFSVGLAFSQCVTDSLPTEEFDQPVNCVICPLEMI